jgi:hypothetical protein
MSKKPVFAACALTFGDRCENHKDVQIIGEIADRGVSCEELRLLHEDLASKNIKSELIDLVEILPTEYRKKARETMTLVIRNGLRDVFGIEPNDLFNEQKNLEWDKKCLMGRGTNRKVKNKNARHNLCYSDFDQEPDYAAGKGRVVSFQKLPLLEKAREGFGQLIPSGILKNLQCEGNLYYDIKKTYIGFHGDAERKIVAAIRLGYSFPLFYQWHIGAKRVSERLKIELNPGDIYIASQEAIGTDWLTNRKDLTIRHAAGEKAIEIADKAEQKKLQKRSEKGV